MNCIISEDYDGEHEYKRPGLYIMQDPNSELILYDELKKGHICHIASLEVVRGENKSYEIDHSGFSLVNGTLSVSHFSMHCSCNNNCKIKYYNNTGSWRDACI